MLKEICTMLALAMLLNGKMNKYRKLDETKVTENEENKSSKSKESIIEEEPQEHDKNIYERKPLEFLDEIDGQYYLEAITWDDRYWLDFYNLMRSVKGKLMHHNAYLV